MKKNPDTIEYFLLRENEQGEETEIALEVSYYTYPGTPGTYWQPEEPTEIDIVGITKDGSREGFDVTDKELEKIYEYVMESLSEYGCNTMCDDDYSRHMEMDTK